VDGKKSGGPAAIAGGLTWHQVERLLADSPLRTPLAEAVRQAIEGERARIVAAIRKEAAELRDYGEQCVMIETRLQFYDESKGMFDVADKIEKEVSSLADPPSTG
jgi:hypothetical protein